MRSRFTCCIARPDPRAPALALSHGLRLADALIAATAIENQTSLITGNVKLFSAARDCTSRRSSLEGRSIGQARVKTWRDLALAHSRLGIRITSLLNQPVGPAAKR